MDNLFKLPNPEKIWIPVNITQFQFSLKETAQLPKLQLFLLSAIVDYKADTNIIADATQLSKILIEKELHQMYKQKLLEFDEHENYQLTKLSHRLLEYSDLISKMNELKPSFLFNFVTGEIQAGVNPELSEKPEGITAGQVVSRFEIDCIEPLEIKDTLLTAFPFLSEKNEEELADFLDNIVIEASHEKGSQWKAMYLTHLPLEASSPEQNELKVRCYVRQKQFKAYDEFLEENHAILQKIQEIHNFDAELLNQKALDLLLKWNEYKQTEPKNFYVHPLTGKINEGIFTAKDSPKRNVLNLQDFQLSDIEDTEISEFLQDKDTAGFTFRKISDTIVTYTSALPTECIVNQIEEET